jgi:hypothetical protein
MSQKKEDLIQFFNHVPNESSRFFITLEAYKQGSFYIPNTQAYIYRNKSRRLKVILAIESGSLVKIWGW